MVDMSLGEMITTLSLRGTMDHAFLPRGARTPLVRCQRVPSLTHDMIDFANPSFEQMARYWFYSFCANPSVDLFAHSRSRF
jgi:hypothetical protein